MKRKLLIIGLVLLLASAPATFAARSENEFNGDEITRMMTVAPDVVVTVCLDSGDVEVHGWDRSEIRARAVDAEKLELQGGAATPAKRVEVLVANSEAGSEFNYGHCQGSGALKLDVPRGATVELKVRSGAVEVTDVSEARIETLSGDVEVRNIAKAVEMSSLSGSVFLKNSSGRVSVRSVSGDVDVADARTLDAGDGFEAKSVSGDVNLDRVTHARVEASSVSGDVSMNGALARAGNYNFKSTTGDVVLTLPADASFRLNARVFADGDIITAFPINKSSAPPMPPTPPAPPVVSVGPVKSVGSVSPVDQVSQVEQVNQVAQVSRVHSSKNSGVRLVGSHGSGDADINLSSFNGTIHLRKREQ